MALSIYDVIKGTITTTKSLEMRQKHGKITFKVNKLANKIMIRQAVEKIWDVKVRDVRTINLPGKTRTIRRQKVIMPSIKKAIVTLQDGYKIDLPDQIETMGAGGSTSKSGGA